MTVEGPRGDERPATIGIMPILTSDYITTLIYIIRVWSIFSCLAFLLGPVFFPSDPGMADLWYRRVHLSGAASQALRLHQRLKGQRASSAGSLLTMLTGEDSFHYLLYSILFAFIAPVSVSVMPVGLMAVLHVSIFTQKLLQASGESHNAATGDGPTSEPAPQPLLSYPRSLLNTAVSKINSNNEPMLRWVALNEIMLMLVCIFVAFTGSRNIMLPFMYSYFVKMRYASRRNPYSRMAFAELRYTVQSLASRSGCPSIISRFLNFGIGVITRMAPQ